MGKNKDKLYYVEGVCELEKGEVHFIGGMRGVSGRQAWYNVIYAIKDKFPEIDFWINPEMSACKTLSSRDNHLRYGICKKFVCTYKPFAEGIIKPKPKLSDLDKKRYKENRAKVDLGVQVEVTNSNAALNDGGFKINSNQEANYVISGVEAYKVRGTVYMVDGKVYFISPVSENYSMAELNTVLDVYAKSKTNLYTCLSRLDELGTCIVNNEIGESTFNEVLSEIELEFTLNVEAVKSKCREIDLYTLCNHIYREGYKGLKDTVDKAFKVYTNEFMLQFGSNAFLMLVDLYIKYLDLLTPLYAILKVIEDTARLDIREAEVDDIDF